MNAAGTNLCHELGDVPPFVPTAPMRTLTNSSARAILRKVVDGWMDAPELRKWRHQPIGEENNEE